MKERKKMVVSFYQISSIFISDSIFDETIDKINYLFKQKDTRFEEQTLKQQSFEDFELRAFHATKTSRPKWQGFVSNLFINDSKITSCLNTSQSFILFIGYKSQIFAIVGGNGSYAIDDYVNQTFGMEIITRIIDKTSPVIRSFQNRGVTGILLGQKKFFRAERRLSDENQFGQIYKEVKADLNQKILKDIFGFKSSDLKRDVSGCLAKTSFQINKSIDFDSALKVVKKLSTLLDQPAKFSINNVELVTKKSSTINHLNNALINELHDCYISKCNPDFDFVHKEFDKYYNAVEYKITGDSITDILMDEPPTLSEIHFQLEKQKSLLVEDPTLYKFSVLNLIVTTYNDGGEILTKGSVLNHLNGEITYEGKTYFYIDSEWYKVKPTFIDELNSDLQLKINEHWDESLLDLPFDTEKDESIYNDGYIGSPNCLVLDTITHENIESCDILKYDNNTIYLVHVKKGFDNRIRELVGQVYIAAKRIEADRITELTFMNNVQKTLESAKYSDKPRRKKLGAQIIPNLGLSGLFKGKKNKQICFCFAFVDDSKGTNRNLKDNLLSYKSNIAKYSLLELVKEINSLGFDFRIIQIKRKCDEDWKR